MKIDRFHHFAISVWDIEKYIPYFRDGFGFEIQQEFVDEQAGTKGVFFKLPGTDVGFELMQPLSEEGSVARNMRTRGEGLHHISFQTSDVYDVERGIEASGLRTLKGVELGGGYGQVFAHPEDLCNALIHFFQEMPEQVEPGS